MPKPEKKDMFFKSANGKNQIAAYFYEPKEVKVRCVIQIVHGMCEYIERYAEFAEFLAGHGIVLCGNDHLGHGKSVNNEKELGNFSEKAGRHFVLRDIWEMNRLAHEAYPNTPIIMLGHSMGSFLARQYAADWPETIDALIISGTSGPVGASGMGAAVASIIAAFKGDYHRSKKLHIMAFGSYLKNVENPKTPYDWISRDEKIVKAYAKDPLCTFVFTTNGFHELFKALKGVSSPKWAQKINKDLPIYMFSGDADPVGQYGKGVQKVYEWLKQAGVKDVSLKMYPGGRHEMLNEINREEVYEDTLKFIESHI